MGILPIFALLALAVVTISNVGATELDISFYEFSCPEALAIVQRGVHSAMQEDRRMPASLLRLHFHDCFVNGCDGSNLLDDRPGFVGEKTATPNLNSARGFNVIDKIKQQLEEICPETVSCADIVAIAARDSVFLSGGPFWDVELGRRDALTTSKNAATNAIPRPTFNVPQLIASFNAVGLDEKDVVSLSGSHTIGKARCTSFQARLYNQGNSGRPDPSLERSYLAELQHRCPQNGDGNVTSPLDPCTPAVFDNQYYKDVMAGRGLLFSDQVLDTTPGTTLQLVEAYAHDQGKFFHDFAASMLKMSSHHVLSSNHGEVRRNCRIPNAENH
ncbi:hypothetical protein M758_1G149200 [Ceratodon purpureus]|nr:hypothetical protein M758_1G149200 [Ceratodon purpureus]